MSLEKPNAGKLVQPLEGFIIMQNSNTNKGTNSGLPNREIPVNVPLSLETENMVDSVEDEEPHRCLRSHYITLQCGCVTLSGFAEYEPFQPH